MALVWPQSVCAHHTASSLNWSNDCLHTYTAPPPRPPISRRAVPPPTPSACCQAEVLLVYEEQVALLQEELISGSQGGAAAAAAAAGLPWLTYQLADMQTLLPQLHMFAHDLRRRPQADALVPVAPHGDVLTAPQAARGAALLRLLALRRHNGQPLLQACLQRIEWHVNQVLCNQLTMW